MTTFEKFRYWRWVPAAVLSIGALSIALLLWADRLGEILRNEANIVDAVMDVQINASATHLWLEHAIYGETAMDAEKIIAGLDQAIKLVDAVLHTGQAEHEWIAEPLDEPQMRARAQEIRTLLVTLKELAQLRIQHPESAGTGTEIHRRYDEIFQEITIRARELESDLEREEVRNVETFRNLFRVVLIVWGIIVVVVTLALRQIELQQRMFKQQLLETNEQLQAQAEELTAHREHLTDLIALRTADLQAANRQLQEEMAERLQSCELLRKTEAQNRQLSSRLLRAQEAERKRIAMELHDELGQALSIVKLRLRAIEKTLGAGQGSLRADCEQLLNYLDQVVEEARRLSLAMSPTILEDLGLTAALHWLIDNLLKLPQLSVTTDIAEIDHLLPREQWITVYRVVQEVLNNVLKHARAEHLSVIVRHRKHTIDFTVEDDGEGFDPAAMAQKGADHRGFGLQTMNERVQMLDGTMKLWSRAGEGTRITFSIPAAKGR